MIRATFADHYLIDTEPPGEPPPPRFDPERLAAWTPPTRPTRATARARRHSPGVQLLPVKDAA